MTPSAQRLAVVLASAALVATLPGCSRIRTHQGYLVDKLLVDSVQPGVDNKASVEGTLGRPTFTSQFGPEEWYYVSREMRQLAFANPKAKEQTILRVRFDPAGNVTAMIFFLKTQGGWRETVEVAPAKHDQMLDLSALTDEQLEGLHEHAQRLLDAQTAVLEARKGKSNDRWSVA